MAFSKDAHWPPHFSTSISVQWWPVGGVVVQRLERMFFGMKGSWFETGEQDLD